MPSNLLEDYNTHRAQIPTALSSDVNTIYNYGNQIRVTDSWMALSMIGSSSYPHLRPGSWISTSGLGYVRDSLNNAYDIMVYGPTCKLSNPDAGIPTKAALSIADNTLILGSGTYKFNDDKFATTSSPQEMRNIQELILTEILQVTERDCDLYVQDGLISMWDGQYNTRAGHNASTTTWEDLVGTNNMTIAAGTFLDKSYSCSTWRCATLAGAIPGVVTMEICCKRATGSTNTPCVFSYNKHHPASNDQFIGLSLGETGIVCFKGGLADYGLSIGFINYQYNINTYTCRHPEGESTLKKYINRTEQTGTGSITRRVDNNYGINPYYTNSSSYVFSGEIYSIRLYNRALTDEEIAHNRNIDEKRFNPAPDYSEYVQSGLISMWDGEWNTRKGHRNMPEVWEDLVGNNNVYARQADGLFQIFNNKYFAGLWNNTSSYLTNAISGATTIEICCLHSDTTVYSPTSPNSTFFLHIYGTGTTAAGFGVYNTDNTTFKAFFRRDEGYFTANKTDINTYSTSGQDLYLNGAAKTSEGTSPVISAVDRYWISGSSHYNRIYNIRLYDRALTADEILHNYYVDRLRFASHI